MKACEKVYFCNRVISLHFQLSGGKNLSFICSFIYSFCAQYCSVLGSMPLDVATKKNHTKIHPQGAYIPVLAGVK